MNVTALSKRYMSALGNPARAWRAVWWHIIGKRMQERREAAAKARLIYKRYPIVKALGAEYPTSGRALLDFIVDPFVEGFSDTAGRSHSNYWVTTAMVDILGELGFVIDVTDWRNMHAPPADDYDLVIGQGHAFDRSCSRSKRKIPRIYLGWGLEAGATQAAVHERSRLLRARRDISVKADHPLDEGPRFATDVYYVGNDYVRDTYCRVSHARLAQLTNPVVAGVPAPFTGKEYESARRNFMWMAAYGTLRRCLDVLLEIFAERPEFHLWICGGIEHEKDFFRAYQRELTELPNVSYVGWVDVAGETYADVTRRCAYMLYPSVSDGMPGSVVNAMAAGVIPIVTESAGMDCGGYGRLIPVIDHAVILKLIEDCAKADPASLAEEACQTAEFARRRYSQDAFRQAFKTQLRSTLSHFGLAERDANVP